MDFEFVSDLELQTKEQLIDRIQWDEAVRILEKGLKDGCRDWR